MDDLEFRRRLLADPNSSDPALVDAASSPERQQLRQEVRHLDQQLEAALDVDVPDDLAERLLLRQNLEVHQHSRRRHRWQLAAAASVAFAVGVSFTLLNTNANDMGLHALAHMEHEADFIAHVNEHVSLASLNTKMKALGSELTSLPGEVRYANYCDFDGIRSLHVVMDTDHGQITLYVIPSEKGTKLPKHFDNDQYNGVGFDKRNLHMAVLGDKDADLMPVMKQLKESMQFI